MSFSRYLPKGHRPSLQLPTTIDLALMQLRWSQIWQRLWAPSFLRSPRLEAWFHLNSKLREPNLATQTQLFCSPPYKNSLNKGAVQPKLKTTTLDAQAQIKTSDQIQMNYLLGLQMQRNSDKPITRTGETVIIIGTMMTMRQLSPAQHLTSRNRILSHWTTIKTTKEAILDLYSLPRQARAAFISRRLVSLWALSDRRVNIRPWAKTPLGFLIITLSQTSVWIISKTPLRVPTCIMWTMLTGAKKSDQGNITNRLDNLSRADKTSN